MHSVLYDISTICNLHNSLNPYFVSILKYNISWKKNEILFALCISLYVFHSMHFTIYISQYAFHSMQFQVCIAEYAFHRMHFTECISHNAFHSMHSLKTFFFTSKYVDN